MLLRCSMTDQSTAVWIHITASLLERFNIKTETSCDDTGQVWGRYDSPENMGRIRKTLEASTIEPANTI